jgi:hypothetical protein
MNPATILIKTLAPVLLGSALLLTGCASIVNGSKQRVKITSQPAGADVRIDGGSSGITPTVADLSRKTSHRVELSLTGYQPYEMVLEPKFNGLTLGNLVLGGIIGIAVDGSTGAGNTLKPEKVDAVLQKK